ncbi:P-loop containing nucleoside triphosphate hydrolase protein [Rickenella mellea]|uniref:P-loop containing nucleoside triphosphate hydrolase protein n=1 Tax=Rickenella mellea TaxID=50990 RepID=A0A4Y7QLE9_9AGAM|nr:P-loop containing nucleoside triphosphate hydrolase protein [Rickenella mellea]
MAPTKKRDQNPSGLGRAIINKKSKDARHAKESNLFTTDLDATNRLQSVTQERDLDEFLSTAQLAGTEFTAEKRNVTIIQAPAVGPSSAHNPFLLTDLEEKAALKRHKENKARLRVPRRPPWTREMSHAQLERQERDAFLEWRRGLAQLQDEENFLLTPFERNLEVWRQLWRVIERSHLIVQIVDARNPLRFRCEDLEAYIQDVEGPEGEHGSGPGKRKSLVLINKADLLTSTQRRGWADYFDTQCIQYAFFSAANAAALQQARKDALELEAKEIEQNGDHDHDEDDDDEPVDDLAESPPATSESDGSYSEDEADINMYISANEEEGDPDPRTKVLSVLELEELFVKSAPNLSEFSDPSGAPVSKLVVGLVGYPNVGKSSTINSLLGEKKVSVSATPGKTKHFQTIPLSSTMTLCDCPGLVFPQFATTKADLVCDGVLPIDQMKEHTGPCSLVVKRLPKEVLEGIYGLNIRVKKIDEGGDGQITAEDFLISYAIARGFARSGQGNPDEARAARYILKDYVNAKLLFCHPPPGISEDEFNKSTRDHAVHKALGKKRAPTTRVGKGADTFVPMEPIEGDVPVQSNKARAVDSSFFSSGPSLSSRPFVQGGGARHGQEYSRGNTFPHQNSVANDGTVLDGRRARIAAVLARAGGEAVGKKHFKANKRVKQRSGKGYE